MIFKCLISSFLLIVLKTTSDAQTNVSIETNSSDHLFLQFENSERWKSSDYRTREWKPDEGKFFFSEEWVYTYKNDLMPEGEFGHKGEMTLYIDPVTGSILVPNVNAQLSNDMVDFILLHNKEEPTYFIQYTDERGDKSAYHGLITAYNDLYSADLCRKYFNEYTTYVNAPKVFNKNKYNPDLEIIGQNFNWTYEMTSDTSRVYIAQVPMDMRLIYLTQTISDDVFLPVQFDYKLMLGKNIVVLEEDSKVAGQNFHLKLTSISPTEYFVEVKKN